MITPLSTVARRYYVLRGLFLIPTGALFIAAGLTNMPPIGDEPVGQVGLFVGALVGAVIAYLLIDRYYRRSFGRIDPPRATKVKVGGYTIGAGILLTIGICVDAQADLPISLYGAAYAACLLAYYGLMGELRPYHWLCLGVLGVLCLVPIWGGVDDKTSLAMIPMGLATIVVGLCDHREMVRSIRSSRASMRPADAHA